VGDTAKRPYGIRVFILIIAIRVDHVVDCIHVVFVFGGLGQLRVLGRLVAITEAVS
jgi:hypothetical protein